MPANVTLVPLPPCAPELNPVERVWLFLRERFLSNRVVAGYDAIVEACCEAWNALTPARLRSLCDHPWIAKVVTVRAHLRLPTLGHGRLAGASESA